MSEDNEGNTKAISHRGRQQSLAVRDGKVNTGTPGASQNATSSSSRRAPRGRGKAASSGRTWISGGFLQTVPASLILLGTGMTSNTSGGYAVSRGCGDSRTGQTTVSTRDGGSSFDRGRGGSRARQATMNTTGGSTRGGGDRGRGRGGPIHAGRGHETRR